MRFALALSLLAACWTTPQAPSSPSAVPGLVWITPAQPWRMTHAPLALTPDGATALVGGAQGWIARVDLRTGMIVRERRIAPDVTIYDLAKLRDGRWIAVGLGRGRTIAMIVDGDTLATRSIVLGAVPDRSYSTPGVAVLRDGGVVIAGKGLPLAIYDPRSWRIRTVLAPELGWDRPTLRGTTLALTRGSAAFAFELDATSATRSSLGASSSAQAVKVRAVLKVYDKGKWFAELWEAGTLGARVADPIETFALAPDGKRLVTSSRGTLDIYSLGADPRQLGTPVRIDLGPAGQHTSRLVLDGDRALVASASLLRVVDLRTGAVTSAGEAPWGSPVQLAVGADGIVLELGNEFVWRLASGRVTATAALGDGHPLVMAPHDVAQYAMRNARTITRHAMVGGATRTWEAPQDPLEGWLGKNGTIVLDTLFDGSLPSRLYRTDGTTLNAMFGYATAADVRDVDPDGGDALIVIGGRVHVRRAGGTASPHTLRTPGCAEFGAAELERGGPRATTYDGRDLAVWDRTTGALLGTARFDEDIARTMFVPGRDEIVVGLPSGLVMLRPGHEARVLALPAYVVAEISADGHRIAIGFGNGQVALVDLDALRASLVPEPTRGFAMVAECKAADPFDVDDNFEGGFEGGED